MKRGGEELQVHMWEEGRSGDEEIRRDNVIGKGNLCTVCTCIVHMQGR